MVSGQPACTGPASPVRFARLNLNYTITSKRKLKQLVDEKHVSGWDDPRVDALRLPAPRLYPSLDPQLLRHDRREPRGRRCRHRHAGVRDSRRPDANAARAMCVLKPLKVVITNYPQDQVENSSCRAIPSRTWGAGAAVQPRDLYRCGRLREVPPAGFKRLVPGGEVRCAARDPCDEAVRMIRAISSSCAARMTKTPWARIPRAAKSKA